MKYRVWRIHNQQHAEWLPCRETVEARSLKEADSKLARKYAKAGFHMMALIAIPFDQPIATSTEHLR